jgi:hypothetical protein
MSRLTTRIAGTSPSGALLWDARAFGLPSGLSWPSSHPIITYRWVSRAIGSAVPSAWARRATGSRLWRGRWQAPSAPLPTLQPEPEEVEETQ